MADGRAGIDFLVQGDRRLTYDEHNALVRRVAAALASCGIGHGDRVAIALGQQRRVGGDVLGRAAIGAVVRAAERVVEGRGARVRVAATPAPRCCSAIRSAGRRSATSLTRSRSSSTSSSTDLDEPDGAARPGVELLGDDPGTLPDVARRRGRPARDHVHVGHDRSAEGRDAHAPPGAREPAEHLLPRHRQRQPGRGGRSRAVERRAVRGAARRAALPRHRLPLDDDADLRVGRQARADAAGPLRPGRGHGDDRARAGHQHRWRPDDHVADRRVAELRALRPLVGPAGQLRRRAGGARARRSGSTSGSRRCARRSPPPTA